MSITASVPHTLKLFCTTKRFLLTIFLIKSLTYIYTALEKEKWLTFEAGFVHETGDVQREFREQTSVLSIRSVADERHQLCAGDSDGDDRANLKAYWSFPGSLDVHGGADV